jgi:hypothetical protein
MRNIRAIALLALAPCHALAAPARIAVADFTYTDSSGEPTDQRAAHATRLAALKTMLIAGLTHSGVYSASALSCPQPPCSVDTLDGGQMTALAQAQHAQYVVFGGVQKISTLIEFGRVDIMNAATGKSALSETISFRGDSDDAWRHAADFVVEELVQHDLK